MDLSAIVVAFGKEQLLAESLASLAVALSQVDGSTETVVVVNELPADATARIAAAPGVTTVAGSPELGFAGGVEAGLAASSGEWVALVNDDCLVDARAFVELLRAAAGRPEIGSVAAQVRFAGRPEVVNSAGLDVDAAGVARERRLGAGAAELETGPVEVFGASATLALYRRRMLEEVGGFDRSFFAYLEDADLAWRARMAGWHCVFAPDAVALHHHSSTLTHGSDAKHFLVGRNRVRMLAKNADSSLLRRQAVRIVVYDLLYVLYVAVTSGSLAPLRGRVRGLAEWRAYRRAGAARRRPLPLSQVQGLREALRRNHVYDSLTTPAAGKNGG